MSSRTQTLLDGQDTHSLLKMLWLSLGIKLTWLDLGKDQGLVQKSELSLRISIMVWFKIKTLRLVEFHRHGYNNKHVVKVMEQLGHA